MFYSIRHSTKFRYSDPVRESVMEVRMQPRSEGNQTLRQFDLSTDPLARIFARRDFQGNVVHHFDVPGSHDALSIVTEALVEVVAPSEVPEAMEPQAWNELDEVLRNGDYWDYSIPSRFARPTELLKQFQNELGLRREGDPLSVVRRLNSAIFGAFSYVQSVTRADSPIDDALGTRQGVCQDMSHIMIALLREIGIPARYVSGYLFHRTGTHDRSVADATHAWVEALMPGYGWIGFDPTNDLLCGDRHIRTAVGRDYADVPPTLGIYRGKTQTELKVAVHVMPADAPRPEDIEPPGTAAWISIPDTSFNLSEDFEEASQQQ